MDKIPAHVQSIRAIRVSRNARDEDAHASVNAIPPLDFYQQLENSYRVNELYFIENRLTASFYAFAMYSDKGKEALCGPRVSARGVRIVLPA